MPQDNVKERVEMTIIGLEDAFIHVHVHVGNDETVNNKMISQTNNLATSIRFISLTKNTLTLSLLIRYLPTLG